MDADKKGIKNKEEDQIKTEVSTPLINNLEMQNIFKDKNNKEGNDVMDEFINKVSWLLVLVRLAAWQIGDIVIEWV